MPSTLPAGDPAPADGALPPPAGATSGHARPFGVYVHVPFCATRCGYCDFNTYTPGELGSGVSAAGYVDAAIAEVRLARRVLGTRDLPVATVFVGGGTPTLLDPGDLARLLRVIDAEFGLVPGAEVTAEANPDTVDPEGLGALRAAGFTRLSVGMQSVRPHVLGVLERTHGPDRAQAAVAAAREAGFAHVNLDLIYGTPGEEDGDWQASLDAAVACGVDHVSAYALIVEEGTRLAARIRRGEVPAPDDDVLADRYVQADETLSRAGFGWYEVSNWARSGAARCRHNLGYWGDGNWWGVGPGAHSHVAGVRWWNVKHPAAYVARLVAGVSPAAAREVLTDEERRLERVLLGVRLAGGHPVDDLTAAGRLAAERAARDGLLDPAALARGRTVLTLRGRLLADAVVRELVA
ncbi:MAG TPA: radical SAM family heme chaperone HemW [Mycobacteriales bacterium]|nr:radical SAM family heme chaperone HemW [Mycobacteriales bacterium]